MKRTQIFHLALGLVLIVALVFTGCQNTPATPSATTSAAVQAQTAETSKQPIEISVSVWDIQDSFPSGEPDAIAKYVADKFNIKLVPVNVGVDDANDKYNTWAASGQLPDIIGAVAQVGTARYFQWIKDGVVRPLPDDFSAYPNINRLMKQSSVTCFAVDGKNYFLPRQTLENEAWKVMERGLLVRKDWMQKLNLPTPKTEDDYINLTVAFAKQDPDDDGKDNTAGYVPNFISLMYSQGLPGFGYTDATWVKDSDGKYRMAVTGEKAFKLMSFYKKMYKAGGLDPDFATMEADQAIDKFASGQVGILAIQTVPVHIKRVMDSWIRAQPDKNFLDCVTILSGPSVDGNYTAYVDKPYWSESYFSTSVDDAKMQRILQLYDWLYSKEGMYMMQYGIEGKDYKIENGAVKLLTPVDSKTGLHTPTSSIYPFTSTMCTLACWTPDLLQYEDPLIPEGIRKMAIEERDYRVANWKTPDINMAVQAIDVPEKQEMSAISFGDDWVKFIMDTSGKSDQELYDAMKKNWDANGYAAAVEAITKKASELGIK